MRECVCVCVCALLSKSIRALLMFLGAARLSRTPPHPIGCLGSCDKIVGVSFCLASSQCPIAWSIAGQSMISTWPHPLPEHPSWRAWRLPPWSCVGWADHESREASCCHYPGQQCLRGELPLASLDHAGSRGSGWFLVVCVRAGQVCARISFWRASAQTNWRLEEVHQSSWRQLCHVKSAAKRRGKDGMGSQQKKFRPERERLKLYAV